MSFSRRTFMKNGGLVGALAAARFKGLPLWAAQPSLPLSCFLHTGADFAPFAKSFIDQIIPGKDSFLTELYAAQLEAALNAWALGICNKPLDLRTIAASLDPTLIASKFGEPTPVPLRIGAPFNTEKVTFPAAAPITPAEYEQQLSQYFGSLGQLSIAEFTISSIDVLTASPLAVSTTVNYHLLGRPSDGRQQERTGEWELLWQENAQAQWSVLRWAALREQRSSLKGRAFVDITAKCFQNNASLAGQLNHGVDYWRTVLDGACGVDIYGNNGVSVGDFDGDGFDDLYVCQPAGLPNRLYRNRGDGTFDDVTEKAGVGVLDATSSAIFADFRNSGHQDLIVVRTNGPLLFLNNGDGTFHHKADAFLFAKPPEGSFTAVAVADYNLDGLLDVYFCLYSYYQGLSDYQFPTPYYDAQNGPPNFLFRNRGGGSFEDVTATSGMSQSNNRYTLACSWNDYNNDGHPDLYVVNDFGRKVLYKNLGNGTFEDASRQAGVEDAGEGMSSTWFDYDNDGWDDLYVVNMWEAAGKRVTTQKEFMPGVREEARQVYRQDAMGNTLLHNERGSVAFREATAESNTQIGGWNWSSGAWDVDHDGFQELYVANGFISGPNKQDLSSFYWRQIVARSFEMGGRSNNYEEAWSTINEGIRSDYTWSGYQRNNFYLNNRDGSFTESASVLGLDCIEDGRAFALADLDGDGRLEVIVKNRSAPQLRVFHNQLELVAPSIAFRLKGVTCNRDAIGAVVEITAGSDRQRQTVAAGSGFLSQHTKTLYFGLGEAQGPVSAIVHWPGSSAQHFENLPAGHTIHIEQGAITFEVRPFTALAEHTAPQTSTASDDLFAPFQTWLVEPIAAPAFSLPTTRGATYTLSSIEKPTLLVLWNQGCKGATEYLRALDTAWPRWQHNQLDLVAMLVSDDSETRSVAMLGPGQHPAFPLLLADEQTRNIYSIFYRYLFERRRDMALPTSFLLNSKAEVIKVYSGPVAPEAILADSIAAPADAASRMEHALPFPGPYFGAGFHHNYFTYGVAYLQYEFLDQALLCFEQAVRINPSQGGAYYNLGLIYLNKNMLNEARTNLEKAVELDPSDANAWNNLGVVSGEKGNYDEAHRYFLKTISLRPSHVLAVQNLVKLDLYQNNPAEAQKVLEAAIAAEPSEAQLHFELAMFFVGQNDLGSAQRAFERTLALQPENVSALNGAGVILMRQGSNAEALAKFQQCVRLNPDFDRSYLNIAALYLKAGEVRKAHDILANFLSNHPDNKEVSNALGQVDQSR